jgi:hypothetical protein
MEIPNSAGEVRERLSRGRIEARAVWGMLFLRPALAVGAQLLLAGILLGAGTEQPWRRAADGWLATLSAAEIVNLLLLVHLARREGIRPRDLVNPGGRATFGGDAAWLVLALVVSAPLAQLPNVWLAMAVWGDAQTGADLLFRPLPVPLAVALVVVFPIVHALTELPTYFGYVMPRLQALTGRRWSPLVACAIVLSAQHAVLPLLLDWRYLVWRSSMFLAFALWVGFVVDRRPTVLPYLTAVHWLLDLPLPLLVLAASTAAP